MAFFSPIPVPLTAVFAIVLLASATPLMRRELGMITTSEEHDDHRAPMLQAALAADRPVARVIYGFQTANASRYTAQLEAQFRSWAVNIPPRDRMVVSGPHDNIGATACDDKDQTCKEAALYYSVAARLHERNDFDWLVSLHEDAYAFPDQIRKELRQFDPEEAVVFGDLGCGRGWPYRVESKGNTTPMPKTFQDPGFHCKAVFQYGGLCGGAGYILSRGAVQRLRSPYTSSFQDYLQEYRSHSTPETPCDLALPCVLYDRNVTLKYFPEHMRSMDVNLRGKVGSHDDIKRLEFWEQRTSLSLLHVLANNKYHIAGFHDMAWSAVEAGSNLLSAPAWDATQAAITITKATP